MMSNPQAPESARNAAQAALPWVVRLRYGIVAGEAAIVLGTYYAFQLDFPLLWTLAPLAVVLASNVWLGKTRDLCARFPDETLGAVFVLDTVCLTAMLGLTGGPNNPFSLLYLVQITLSAVALRKAWTRALGALATASFGLLFFVHIPLAALQAHNSDNRLSPHLVGMWIAFVVGVALITFFTGKISDALRRREREVFELQEQVAKHERLGSLVTLAAGAAHELGTPLGTIAVVAKELERYASALSGSDSVLEDARLIRSEVERCRRILERMSVQGAEPMGEAARKILVADLLNEVVEQLPESQRTVVVVEVEDEGLAAVLPEQATLQSVAALLQNAIDANREQRPVIVRASGAGPELSISIRDRGHGMPESVLRRIAEPFFTTKEPGKGMGLGTFLVRTFAERLGGRLLFESADGQGTVVTLLLPLGKDAHAAV
ncbi:MAG: ATP-binding protein [Bryobacteraceae bacterium]|jgi:two-component system, sensor histidine kinase RegB